MLGSLSGAESSKKISGVCQGMESLYIAVRLSDNPATMPDC